MRASDIIRYRKENESLMTVQRSHAHASHILDKREQLRKQSDEMEDKFLICSSCDSLFNMQISACGNCGSRFCASCQRRRSGRLHGKYKNCLERYVKNPIPGYRVQFWTFTFKNTDVISREWLDKRDKQFVKFWNRLRMRGFKAKYGFRAKECTYHADRGFHYHYHVLFYGPAVNLKDSKWNVSLLWKEATGDSFMVKVIDTFDDARKGLSYILKYVCKTRESNEGLIEYFRIRSGSRDFNTFGEDFTRKKKGSESSNVEVNPEVKLPFECPTCGGSFRKSGRFTTAWRRDDVTARFHVEDARPFPSYRARLILHKYRYGTGVFLSQTILSNPCGLERTISSREQSPTNPTLSGILRSDKLISRIDYLFDQEYNADVIEAVLGPDDVAYLLRIGVLYSPRPGRYERL
jgi:uncharacterized CHY-type Zn-finger protein